MQGSTLIMLAPIIIFVYNRADHFQRTFDALSACPEAKKSDLFIFSDAAKNASGEAKVQEVRHAVHDVASSSNFKSITIREAKENLGLAASVIAGATEVISQYGRVIVVEDDCAASPHFLSFMNRCLDAFEDNPKIGSIAGYAPPIVFPDDYKEDIFLAWRSCSMTWATWKSRWNNIDWDLKEISQFYRKPELIKCLNANGNDRFIRLYRQTKGNGSSWSVRFGAHLVKNGCYTVYPRYSYIQNIGCDESGIHSKSEDAELIKVDLNKAIPNPNIKLPEFRQDIQDILKKYYSSGLISSLKRELATRIIVLRGRLGL